MQTGCASIPRRYDGAIRLPSRPALLLLAILLAGVSILFFFNPDRCGFYPVCLFHQTTGLFCPGCGSLRALHQLLHGHVGAAFHFNALLVLAMPMLFALALRLVIRRYRNQPSAITIRPEWLWWGFAVVLVFGIVRNLPLSDLAWLGPR